MRNNSSKLSINSLGAAMVMLAGRWIAEEGQFLEARLFNPPFFSAPVDRIRSKKVKRGLHVMINCEGQRNAERKE